ncbi:MULTISPECIES: HD-GYP domain-containing protein [Roseomonadaceae]|uniref:HD domain-containing protein n=1 Tax=Falsiroseomonas oleicola TaxID=2801474 RepID=A0ABS6HD16_9PROT|nr:HD domain-containing phosphohydrolase [Roseomonas oleicola]MBU8546604.1 HD domain-containing protein [Roseomonas oleicola]
MNVTSGEAATSQPAFGSGHGWPSPLPRGTWIAACASPGLAWLGRLRHHHEASAAHAIRVTQVLMAMWACAPETLGDREALLVAALLHDIGKLAVPASILASDKRLDAAEAALVRRHPEAGAELLRGQGFAPEVVAAARHHHERWQGGGYPTGLPAARLPSLARAVAVADAFVAMVEPGRAYRQPITVASALAEIDACSGTHFDPRFAAILAACLARPSPAIGAALALDGDEWAMPPRTIPQGPQDA